MTTTTLFLSYTTLIRLLAGGDVSDKQLETGVFYFNCTRDYVFDSKAAELNWFCDNGDEKAVVHRRIMQAVRQAEAEGRAAFRVLGKPRYMETLQELLSRTGVNIKGWEELGLNYGVHPLSIDRLADHFGLEIEAVGYRRRLGSAATA